MFTFLNSTEHIYYRNFLVELFMDKKLCTFFKSAFACLALFLFGCDGSFSMESGKEKMEEISVANWNVQTFFDSTNDGCEYDEFISNKKWGKASYAERLSRLASSIKAIDADVLVMEEIENEAVLHDISNFLAGEWNQKKIYRYACFAKDEGSSIGCGVLSRYPLENLTLHSIDVRTEISMPKMRPLMQLTVCKGEKKLVLFVNHWKSMSGGEDETELWRMWQESVLCKRIMLAEKSNAAILACGDFNRDINDFKKCGGQEKILLREKADGECENGVCVHSPWFDSGRNLVEPGSYFFRDEWSRIDNFFAAGSIEIVDFYPVTSGPWCDSETHVPEKYQVWSGNGYSDHLPIFCVVRF